MILLLTCSNVWIVGGWRELQCGVWMCRCACTHVHVHIHNTLGSRLLPIHRLNIFECLGFPFPSELLPKEQNTENIWGGECFPLLVDEFALIHVCAYAHILMP